MKQKASATTERHQRHRRQFRALQVGPGPVQPARRRGDLAGEPEIERQRHHGDDRGGRRRDDGERGDPAFDIARRRRIARPQNSQQAAAQRVGDGLGVGAERQHGRNRGQCGKACDPEQDAADRIPFELRRGRRGTVACGRIGQRPSQQREMAEPPGRQRNGDDKGDAVGQAEDRAEAGSGDDAADRRRDRSPSEGRHHQRQRRQIEQQQ